jgi:glycosyltransferase involved in cell wall biosynthesis
MTYLPEDLTFVICAYKESQYLEECIQSVLHQTIPVNVIMSTSTPNEYIKNLCEKYKIELFVNNEPSDIANDWNFAISKVSSKLVTIAHQDDVYKKNYAEMILQKINISENPLIAFSDYSELRNGKEVTNNKLLNIKRKLLSVIKHHPKSIFFRRRSLSLGNAICCPAVTYVLENLPQPIFIKGMKSNIDWDAWERLSLLSGSFCYVDEVLMSHRIHSDSTTSEVIQETGRQAEDLAMLKKFWPNWIANIIEWKYKDSEKQNNL